MELTFSANPANYRSFSFDFKRGTKEYETFFGVCLSSLQSEWKRNANVIVEHIAKLEEPKSIFKIDGGLSIDFNNESKTNLDCIISDFINKLKYKKYKTLGLWVPLLQDHFWNNAEKPQRLERKRRKGSKPKPLELKPTAKYGFKPSLTYFRSSPVVLPDADEIDAIIRSGDDIIHSGDDMPTYEQFMEVNPPQPTELPRPISKHEILAAEAMKKQIQQRKIQGYINRYNITGRPWISATTGSSSASTTLYNENDTTTNFTILNQ